MVWRRMLFDKYQDCCLVLCHPDIFFYSEPPCLPGFCSRGHMVLKKNLLEEFQDGCLMHGHL